MSRETERREREEKDRKKSRQQAQRHRRWEDRVCEGAGQRRSVSVSAYGPPPEPDEGGACCRRLPSL